MAGILDKIEEINAFIYDNILSIAMMVCLLAVGIFFFVRLRALQFRRFGFMMKNTVGALASGGTHEKDAGAISPFQAVTNALAATIGTGSIAGIATALVAGGPGAVFWMWVSALLGMATKYAEIVLSLKYREKDSEGAWRGGPMYYIRNGLGIKWLAALFAVFAMMACLGIGNATQSNSISQVLESNFSVPAWVTGLVLLVIVSVVILGGVKRIASVNEKLVPFMAVFFILAALVGVCVNITKVPAAFGLIFREAFNFKAAFGGTLGYGVFVAMRVGFGRGVFTNEAGLGSAPIAHAASSTKDPVKQGMWGMFEVFITTIVICTMSALVVLTSDVYLDAFGAGVRPSLDGAALSTAAFGEALGTVGSVGVSLATVFFALSTILGWGYYGEVAAIYLFGKRSKRAILVYRIIYVAVMFLGTVANIELVWGISDTMNVLMAIPNLVALIGLCGVVVKETKEHFSKNKT